MVPVEGDGRGATLAGCAGCQRSGSRSASCPASVAGNPRIDKLILAYLTTFLRVPNLSIAARWHGTYVKHPAAAYVVARLTPEALAVTGVSRAGMTQSFGLAEQVVSDWLGETQSSRGA